MKAFGKDFVAGKCGAVRRALTAPSRKSLSLAMVLFLAACASQDSSRITAYDDNRAQRVFTEGYEDISEIYIERVQIADLATAGLDGLASIEPALSLDREDNLLTLYYNGVQAGQFEAPEDRDVSAWGEVTASVISVGRDKSDDLEDRSAEEVYETIFDGMLSELDEYSRYSGREAARENRASRDGFGGIGIRIRIVEEGVLVQSVMEGTPAEASGLIAEDLITEINGVSAAGLSQREAVRRLRGPVQSIVRLTIDRNEISDPLSVKVSRAHIVPQTVTYERKGNVAYIEVSSFNQDTTRSLEKKVALARAEMREDLHGFVIDLRGNPGGLLDQAVSVSDLFIDSGRIVSTRGRHPDSHQFFDAGGSDITGGKPIAVLINGNSASASEIVAAALQDSRRAILIGSSSFGKGTVQTLLRLPNEGELTLTWARFFSPAGYALHHRGVIPHLCTSTSDADADQILTELRQGQLRVDRKTIARIVDPNDSVAVESLRANCPSSEKSADLDVELAIALLQENDLFARTLRGSPNTADLGLSLATE